MAQNPLDPVSLWAKNPTWISYSLTRKIPSPGAAALPYAPPPFLMCQPPEADALARWQATCVRLFAVVLYGDPGKKIVVFPSLPTMMGCRLLHAAAMQGHRAAAPNDANWQDAVAPSPTGSPYVAAVALSHRWSSSGRRSLYAANAAAGGKDWSSMRPTPLLWGAGELRFQWAVDGLESDSDFGPRVHTWTRAIWSKAYQKHPKNC